MSGSCVAVTAPTVYLALVVGVAAVLYRWSRACALGRLCGAVNVVAALFVLIAATTHIILPLTSPRVAAMPQVCTSMLVI